MEKVALICRGGFGGGGGGGGSLGSKDPRPPRPQVMNNEVHALLIKSVILLRSKVRGVLQDVSAPMQWIDPFSSGNR